MNQANFSIELPEDLDPSWRIGIIHSSFYKEDVQTMIASAKQSLIEAGIYEQGIQVHPVAGCFEIPLIGSALAEKGEVDALMGLGIVVQGETQHAQAIVEQAAKGMMEVQTRFRIPFAFEVLHVNSLEDAKARCESKGKEAAVAVVHSLAELRLLRS
ncbi:6,7-dimethyl-8-ribityllumazine synthase [Patescibacteria group bacterium]|nr:6,7-dimethyl-8-ribityllumazine synthase [Patescibacteria group bacterium]MBU2259667.1 6,7-dimethyl-8-ribityllumazine synthase [Patescibacteria group bacterium]